MLKVNDYAISIESGWLGKIVAFEEINGDRMARMVGVDWVPVVFAGKSREESLDEYDTRWFDPRDLEAAADSEPAFSL